MTNLTRSLILGCSVLALAGCGADDVAVPGGSIIITPAPTAPPPPPPVAGGSITAAAACTPGTTDGGTIALQGSRGTVRNCVVTTAGGVITAPLNLTGRRADGIMYSICGRTDIGRDVSLAGGGAAATLTVSPGVTVFACSANRETTIVVNRGSRLVADGTAAQPIIFTSEANLTNNVGGGQPLTEATDNLWGGLIINGRAPVSDCDTNVSSSTVGGDAGCWRQSEGIVTNRPLYGGNVANDNSGTLRYVQVNFTGVGQNADEVQGITANGMGSGTIMSYIQIHNSRDDGIESFGGRQNMDHLVFTGIADDSLDTDNGYRGAVQFVLAVRRGAGATIGDAIGGQTILEIDSSTAAANDAQPRQYLRLANFTLIQNTPNEPAIRMRGGADAEFTNGLVIAKSGGTVGCLDVDDAATVQAAGAATDELGPPVFRSVAFDCATLIDADADVFEETALSNAANSNVTRALVSTLVTLTTSTVGLIAPGTAELALASTALTTPFAVANYRGAFSGPGDTWTQGWTCNSDVANLRGALACTDIRVF
ncbi:MAG: hypothetical protein B7Z08_12865 [Sphingomonadales bacterium 32-68-7]|nr:MAG: hypothetical protein B7Z33_08390 [Sphingomonadales bacterium 12-68-11]OYX07139.1 MAG: hypothetical protein B7Z08_12865 [Sphingomonadales bacterium 32-68-7]